MSNEIDKALEALERLRTSAGKPYWYGDIAQDANTIRRALERQRARSITAQQLKDALNILSIDNDMNEPDYRLAARIFAAAPETEGGNDER